jgi:hypothetical protein
MLMPFEKRFDQVADIIRETVEAAVSDFRLQYEMQEPVTTRLDWVNTSGAIHQQIWQEVSEADLVFCDITGYNPNVMFEAGVAAAWKPLLQVVFIKDRYFRQPSAFDLQPFRYTEYELTSEGIDVFKIKIRDHTHTSLVRFPDRLSPQRKIRLPLKIDFSSGRDDLRIYTPPFAHRRVANGEFEFGSVMFYAHSWASIGAQSYAYVELDFHARFLDNLPIEKGPKIGVAMRSQHFFANFAHHISLAGDGTIWITEPDETQEGFYRDRTLRGPTAIDLAALHHFNVIFGRDSYSIKIDDFFWSTPLAEMPKVLSPGPIRFQSARSRMGISRLALRNLPKQQAKKVAAFQVTSLE